MPYAVILDGYAIYGIGDTEEAAIADASKWVGDPEDLIDLPSKAPFVGDMFIAPCTEALVAEVKRIGGAFAYGELPDGTICLESEEDA